MFGIGDIVERNVDADTVQAPQAPDTQRVAARKASRFQRQRHPEQATKPAPAPAPVAPTVESTFGKQLSEREKIHLENLKKLSQMDESEIEKEREELMSQMDPNILQALLRRAQLNETAANDEFDGGSKEGTESKAPQQVEEPEREPEQEREQEPVQEPVPEAVREPTLETATDAEETEAEATKSSATKSSATKSSATKSSTAKSMAGTVEHPTEASNTVHFAKPPPIPDSEDFLDEMHAKYFPDLEVEADKLAWMRPMSEEEIDEYSAQQESVVASELRFDFAGNLVTPRQSKEIDVSEGLHHHGDAPAAAGYTVPELAHLARSTNNGQRSIAIRTLGRVLYRLGQLGYGKEISSALHGVVDRHRVYDSLVEAADESRTRSVAVRAYATEALWLWKGHRHWRPAV